MAVTILELQNKKQRGEKITMLTAYEYTTALSLDRAGVDVILVGDSLGMVFQGKNSTLTVTLEEMIYHTQAVARGVTNALIVGDMPFLTYQVNIEEAVRHAGLFLQNGANAVKIEGGVAIAPTLRRMVDVGIPVMGHIGLTPQSVNQLSGYRVQGKLSAEIVTLLADARALEDAGAFAVVVECIPAEVASEMANMLKIPLIGIGAGPDVDGQVLVTNDMLGTYPKKSPKFARRYANLAAITEVGVSRYITDVKNGSFPDIKESYFAKPPSKRKK